MLQVEALEILKTGANVFLTGVPGAGKTYVINQYVRYLEDHGIYPAITATTGIAATHVGGQTIHSFSGIGIEKYLDDYKIEKILEREKLVKKIQHTKVLIIDEISMLDAQTLDNVDKVLKAIKDPTKAFGGIQIIFVGDFFQLPPIMKRDEERKFFAFFAKSWKEARPLTCYLEEQFRQTDEVFTKLLLAIRENNIDEMHVEILEELKKKTFKKLGLKEEKILLEGEYKEEEIEYDSPTLALPTREGVAQPYKTAGYRNYDSLKNKAIEMRKEPTQAEDFLWENLRDDKLGSKFRRQHLIENFIVDFANLSSNLIVEVDGKIHDSQIEKDKERTKILENLGIKILRFKNEEILMNIDDVLNKIRVALAPSLVGRAGVGLELDILELHSHNKNVDEINNLKLSKIFQKEFVYKMITQGRAQLIEGLIRNCLSPEILKLKVGAKVIFTKNSLEGEYVNGTMGKVVELESFRIIVETSTGKMIDVKQSEWAIEEDGKVKARISQYPLRLAWAITVHKSQGMSLDEAIINLGETFEFGQGYVALSRLRSLDGLYLKSYNPKSLQVNGAICEYDEKIRKDSRFIQNKFLQSDREKLLKTQNNFIEKCGGVISGNVPQKIFEKKKETKEITLDLIKVEKTLSEIIEIRGVKFESILKHLEELYDKRKVSKLEISKILDKDETYKKINVFSVPNEIKKTFKKNQLKKDEEGNIKLAPVFKELKEKYSFEELRIYRIFLDL